jgi:hypothetical protein
MEKKLNVYNAAKKFLGGKTVLEGEKKYNAKAQIKKYGLKEKEEVTFVNPLTKKSTAITISRTGTDDKAITDIFSNKNSTRDQKNSAMAAYLWEQGKENASFLMELFLAKGNLTKETQVFKKQMRFDYEVVVDAVCWLFKSLASDIDEYYAVGGEHSQEEVMRNMSRRMVAGADLLLKRVQEVTLARMQDKGYGIYVSKDGEIYDIHTDPNEIVDKVAQDSEDVKNESQND